MFLNVKSVGLNGLNAFSVDVEIEAHRGIGDFKIVGMGDVAIKEANERIKAAFRSSGLSFPRSDVVINLAPADVKKYGSATDLPMAVAIMAITGAISLDVLENSVFIGELSLGGAIRSVNGVLPMTIHAYKNGARNVFVPFENATEASVVEGVKVYGVRTLSELLMHLTNQKPLSPKPPYEISAKAYQSTLDFCDVKGQQFAKKALEVAACGGHNVIMVGSPGSGKSMLAKRLPGILPKMSFEESIETTNVYSIAGLIDPENPLITLRPFRNPHHTVSAPGLTGGGAIPRPGEISLAHNGLLFLDELAEFSRHTLEILRQPMEDGKVTISRASGTITYPCNFVLVAAMNPCPCGYFGHPTKKCTCNPKQVSQYLSRISGPMLDRFDLHIEVAPVEYESIASRTKEEESSAILERVQKAREAQNQRYKGTGVSCNARITSDILHQVCPLTPSADELLKQVFEKMGLSARAYDKILKVARTVADMDGSEVIDRKHISQAVRYRSLDRKYWA